ncbi:MAG: hypothetical protein V1493_02640 [Candidatus Diapherotrites archaeon]
MKRFVILSLLAILILFAGCTDISGSAKAGNFGNSAKDQQILNYFKTKYGDLSIKGNNPRIIEPLMATSITDYIPADIVSKYSKSTQKLYVWFVYDDFSEGDTIEVKWVYKGDGTTIHTFSEKTGPDFGRASFSLEMPDSGWPVGKYSVTISGKGVSATVDFEIIDGATVSEPIPFLGAVPQPTPSATPEATATPAAIEPTPTPVQDELLYSNSNIGGCSYTDTSTIVLEEDAHISKLRMWYYWNQGETTLSFTLKKGEEVVDQGNLERASCDPYQTSWCEANYYPDKDFTAGTYVLKAGIARLCQNSESQGNGMYMVFGKKLGTTTPSPEVTPAAQPTAAIGSQTSSGFTVQELGCSFTGSWSSNWGDMEFKQDGSKVTATYTYDSGKIDAVISGNILIGKWSEAPSYAEPGDAGDVELELSTDCKSFTGNWRYGTGGAWSGGWTGTKK